MKVCPQCNGGSLGKPPTCAQCGADLREVEALSGTLLVGMRIGDKYELAEFIGDGAMGWVYRGVNLALGNSVAVKLMKPSPDPGKKRDERFQREAHAVSRLNHPHILAVLDFGRTPGGLLYLISEFLTGVTLADMIDFRGAVPLERAVRIFLQILSAVEEAHSRDVVHRDLKPENIIVNELRSGEDFVKVLDFGIAKVLGDGPDSHKLTLHGQIFGTPGYMAPEQIRGQGASKQSDLYSLGVILYEMLVGRQPFESHVTLEILSMHLHHAPPAINLVAPEKRFPRAIGAVLERSLAKDPTRRYATIATFRDELTQALKSAPSSRDVFPCPACGHLDERKSKFCPECGFRLAGPRTSSPSTPAITVDDAPAMAPGLDHRGWTPDDVVSPVDPDETEVRPLPVVGRPARRSKSTRTTASSSQEIPLSPLGRLARDEPTLDLALVGADEALEQLDRFFSGDAAVLEVLGPLGSGKSTLLEEAARRSLALDIPLVRAGADPALTAAPWYPIRKAVCQVLGIAVEPADMQALAAHADAAKLAREELLGLAELLGVPIPIERPEFAVRLRELQAGARRALLSSQLTLRGLCLVFDDVHDYDTGSRNLVVDLCRRAPNSRVKVIVASEGSKLPADIARTVVVPPALDAAAVATLIDSGAQSAPSDIDQVSAWIAERTEGRALECGQAVRLVLAREELDDPADPLPLRLRALPVESLRLLRLVSAWGNRVEVGAARRLYGDDESWDDAITILVRRGFLGPEVSDVLSLGHATFGEQVLGEMEPTERRELHAKILAVVDDPLLRARQALLAGDSEEALIRLGEAATRAESWLDDATAAQHLQRAMQLARWELLLEPDDDRVLALAIRLADTTRYVGDLVAADLVVKEYVAAADRKPEEQCRLLRSAGRLALAKGDEEEAIARMREAAESAAYVGAVDLLIDMYLELGRVLVETGRYDDAARELSEGARLADPGGSNREVVASRLWRVQHDLADALARGGHGDIALGAAEKALVHAEQERTVIGRARAHELLGRLRAARGELRAAHEHYEAAVTAFIALGDRQSAAQCLLATAAQKQSPTYQKRAQRALEMFRQLDYAPGAKAARELLGDGLWG